MARLVFDAIELESFWCSTTQSFQKLRANVPAILMPFATTYLMRIWIFLSTSFEKQVSEPFHPLERFVRDCE